MYPNRHPAGLMVPPEGGEVLRVFVRYSCLSVVPTRKKATNQQERPGRPGQVRREEIRFPRGVPPSSTGTKAAGLAFPPGAVPAKRSLGIKQAGRRRRQALPRAPADDTAANRTGGQEQGSVYGASTLAGRRNFRGTSFRGGCGRRVPLRWWLACHAGPPGVKVDPPYRPRGQPWLMTLMTSSSWDEVKSAVERVQRYNAGFACMMTNSRTPTIVAGRDRPMVWRCPGVLKGRGTPKSYGSQGRD